MACGNAPCSAGPESARNACEEYSRCGPCIPIFKHLFTHCLTAAAFRRWTEAHRTKLALKAVSCVLIILSPSSRAKYIAVAPGIFASQALAREPPTLHHRSHRPCGRFCTARYGRARRGHPKTMTPCRTPVLQCCSCADGGSPACSRRGLRLVREPSMARRHVPRRRRASEGTTIGGSGCGTNCGARGCVRRPGTGARSRDECTVRVFVLFCTDSGHFHVSSN